MDMVVLGIDKCFVNKDILMLLIMSMRGCLTLELNGRMSIPELLALCVVRDIRVGIWPVGMVAMGVVRVAT